MRHVGWRLVAFSWIGMAVTCGCAAQPGPGDQGPWSPLAEALAQAGPAPIQCVAERESAAHCYYRCADRFTIEVVRRGACSATYVYEPLYPIPGLEDMGAEVTVGNRGYLLDGRGAATCDGADGCVTAPLAITVDTTAVAPGAADCPRSLAQLQTLARLPQLPYRLPPEAAPAITATGAFTLTVPVTLTVSLEGGLSNGIRGTTIEGLTNLASATDATAATGSGETMPISPLVSAATLDILVSQYAPELLDGPCP